jgi:hypothetical protein
VDVVARKVVDDEEEADGTAIDAGEEVDSTAVAEEKAEEDAKLTSG